MNKRNEFNFRTGKPDRVTGGGLRPLAPEGRRASEASTYAQG